MFHPLKDTNRHAPSLSPIGHSDWSLYGHPDVMLVACARWHIMGAVAVGNFIKAPPCVPRTDNTGSPFDRTKRKERNQLRERAASTSIAGNYRSLTDKVSPRPVVR